MVTTTAGAKTGEQLKSLFRAVGELTPSQGVQYSCGMVDQLESDGLLAAQHGKQLRHLIVDVVLAMGGAQHIFDRAWCDGGNATAYQIDWSFERYRKSVRLKEQGQGDAIDQVLTGAYQATVATDARWREKMAGAIPEGVG